MPDLQKKAIYRHIPVAALSDDELLALSQRMKLSLSKEDMLAVRKIFAEEKREPTDVELEVIAQTWSEHCKHRIFGALIEHTVDGKTEIVDGLFKTYIKAVTERIIAKKPGFVLSAFTDNAGFVKLDDNLAVCLKAETHNHPSAIEPYAGANTGLGGVIRDILGAGKGAKPIASLDVFCFGPPDTHESDIKAKDVIHPLGIMRGVVRGVRDYGNRMGIPTTSGAIAFDKTYIYNPLVFCGTMGRHPHQGHREGGEARAHPHRRRRTHGSRRLEGRDVLQREPDHQQPRGGSDRRPDRESDRGEKGRRLHPRGARPGSDPVRHRLRRRRIQQRRG